MTVTYLPYTDLIEDEKVRANFEYIESNACFGNLGVGAQLVQGSTWSGTYGGTAFVGLFVVPLTIKNPNGAAVAWTGSFSCYTTVVGSIMMSYVGIASGPANLPAYGSWQSSRLYFNQTSVHTAFPFGGISWDTITTPGGFSTTQTVGSPNIVAGSLPLLKLPPGDYKFGAGVVVPAGSQVTFDLNDGGHCVIWELP